MNAKKFTVIGLLSIVALFFYLGMNAYQSRVQTAQDVQVKAEQTRLVRMHSPVFGPQNAPVTIVEFFDPACETCRACYPIVKNLMAQYPDDVRLVIRYAPFHQGSDVVVKLLESSKSQGKYQAVLEAVLLHSPPGPITASQTSRPLSGWLNRQVWTSPRRGRTLRNPAYGPCCSKISKTSLRCKSPRHPPSL